MDISLYHIDAGAGAPLILLHGNGESSDYFAHQTAYFSRRYRVLALDTRGHGRSPRGSAPFTLAQFAEDLLAFMDQQGLEKAHILGFSDGANIALLFALAHPERVDRLILNGANLYPGGVKPWIQWPTVAEYHLLRPLTGRSPGLRRRRELLGLMVNEPHIDPASLAALTMPALVIAGTRDMIADAHSQLIADSLPNAALVRIDGDHFIAAKAPEVFDRAVEAFLARAD